MFRLIFLCCLSIGIAHAAPAPADTDDLEALINQSSVASEISQIGQRVGNQASELVVNAMGFLGVPYKRGGTGVSGFDCSGFVRAMYASTLGLVLPHNAKEQAAVTQTIDKDELQPGDLVFFNTLRRAFSHVGIYVGDGKFIHAPRPGKAVRMDDMREAYWQKRFNGARRVQVDKLQNEPAKN